MRMGIHSLKDWLREHGCPESELDGVSDKDTLLDRVAPKYLGQAHSNELHMQDMTRKMRELVRQAGVRGPIDLTECSSFLAHRNYDVYQATDDYLKFHQWSGEKNFEIAEEVYLQGRGFGVPPDESARHNKRRADLREKAAHEHYLNRFPAPPIPKERPKVAIFGEVKLPEHLLGLS